MLTIDEIDVRGPLKDCFRAAADVEQWPLILPHYRWVTFHTKVDFGTGQVEMAARRQFGPLPYPVWWVSRMHLDTEEMRVLYHHVDGITRGMDVEWSFQELDAGTTRIRIVHDWPEGPAWPIPGFARRAIANHIIGPIFIHHVAGRTLAGIRRHVEGLARRESAA